jgi:F-type H+-transporting ATPase subunit delta
MSLNALSTRYAQALFSLAEKGKGHDHQLAELLKVKVILDQSGQLTRAINSPTVPAQVKKTVLKRLFDGRIDSNTLHFLYVLVDKNRESNFDGVIESYKHLLREHRNEVAITVKSVQPLDAALVAEVEKVLLKHTGRKIELKTETDPELLGGLVIQIGDRVIDTSLKRQLLQIQERLTKVSA